MEISASLTFRPLPTIEPPVSIRQNVGGPQSRSGYCEVKKRTLPLIKPRFLVVQPTAWSLYRQSYRHSIQLHFSLASTLRDWKFVVKCMSYILHRMLSFVTLRKVFFVGWDLRPR
jgi:hypothetical protein